MIKKVIEIKKDIECSDSVELSWFDMQKPNLSAVSTMGVEFIIKVKFSHLHGDDILVCEDGYTIRVKKAQDDIYELDFNDNLYFAKIAYEIGNRHQPIYLDENKIIVLDDISLHDILNSIDKEKATINKTKGYFKPNGKASHSH